MMDDMFFELTTSWIDEFVCVGGFPAEDKIPKNINSILNLSRSSFNSKLPIRHIPLTYWEYKKPELHLRLCLTNLLEMIDKHGTVYVHCRLGLDRSGILAVAYLIQKGYSLEEALQIFQKKRESRAPRPDALAVLNQLISSNTL